MTIISTEWGSTLANPDVSPTAKPYSVTLHWLGESEELVVFADSKEEAKRSAEDINAADREDLFPQIDYSVGAEFVTDLGADEDLDEGLVNSEREAVRIAGTCRP